ncbi:hypothetical protein tinsulaeT_28200 [Thalassotalea insulae]|uniref:Uncharacterized protein n=1 Tax=Thalassotalea insulae TaxID=2056778 RepID=A0ABQ6GY92_9GAMM|nr:hypothetical protein [Thalassotalea insulae]GLX79480.1 hypothetical protein tinsulaeT_28200 [Thalassotalea insulae]
MEISKHKGYLSLEYSSSDTCYKFSYSNSLEDKLQNWKSSTRISPVWPVSYNDSNNLPASLGDSTYFVFLGAYDPVLLNATLQLDAKEVQHWISLGMMNNVLHFNDKNLFTELLQWCEQNLVNVEAWERVANNDILRTSVTYSKSNQSTENWRVRLTQMLSKAKSPGIQLALSEFCPLLASTISRLELNDKRLYEEYVKLIDYVELVLETDEQLVENRTISSSVINTLNAGLSRFSSQTLSGISPISSTESHFWIHSLLGIGVASLGLSNLVSFISKRLGESYIPDKFLHLNNKSDDIPDLMALHSTDPFWEQDYLGISLNNVTSDDLAPDIAFFSGRDGFKAHLTNISVPLTSVFSSSSEKWTLLTITHEISHKILKAVLSLIFPIEDIGSGGITKKEAKSLYEDRKYNSWLDSIRVWLWSSIIDISAANKISQGHLDRNENIELVIDLLDSIDEWYGEVEEIIVHVFDFLYFYRGQESKYIKEIWMTWSVIPNISNRVPEYVVRTTCAILSSHLHRGIASIDSSIEIVKSHLERMLISSPQTPYLTDAIDFIKNDREQLKQLVDSRKTLVRFTKTFLHSESVMSELWAESSSAQDKVAPHRKLTHYTIDNPLVFLDRHSDRKIVCEAESAWIFYNLAFSLR